MLTVYAEEFWDSFVLIQQEECGHCPTTSPSVITIGSPGQITKPLLMASRIKE
jgi:hypothetical protein